MNLPSPKRSFGQNYLVNPSAITQIVHETLQSSAPEILEIGPGRGALTHVLLQDGRPLHAIEMDPEHRLYLETTFSSIKHFHVHEGDALTLPMPSRGPFTVVGNLPYNASTAILTRFLMEDFPWDRLVFMFQKEVGDKLLGGANEKAYGPLSILLQLCTEAQVLLHLKAGSFYPVPNIDSVVLTMHPRRPSLTFAERSRLLQWLHVSFAHRRKTLRNNWQGHPDEGLFMKALSAAGLSDQARAESLSPAVWAQLLQHGAS